jgi:tetratricopeptide (TPR) repeat protein
MDELNPKRRKIIFCRIGWMNNYKGIDNDSVSGGFEWVREHNYGHEMFNYLPIDGMVYGYVKPQANSINLERIGECSFDDKIENVLVVFFAACPKVGQIIVGWYKNATVFKEFQEPIPAIAKLAFDKYEGLIDDRSCLCWMTAFENDAFLIPVADRKFIVPRQKHFTGQSNVWYCDSENGATQDYVDQVIYYIDNYKPGLRINSKYFLKVLPRFETPMVTPDLTNFNIIKELKAKLAENPKDIEALKKIADIHTDDGNWKWGMKYIQVGLQIAPRDWELHFWKGLANKYGFDDIDEAEKEFKLAFEYAQKSINKAEILNEVGLLYYGYRDNIKEALSYFEKGIGIDPNEAYCHSNRAMCLDDTGYPEKGVESIIKAFNLKPDDNAIMETMVQIYENLIKTKHGKTLFRDSLVSCLDRKRLLKTISESLLSQR